MHPAIHPGILGMSPTGPVVLLPMTSSQSATILALAILMAAAACDRPGESPARPADPPVARIAIGEDSAAHDATTIVGKPAPPWEVDTWIGSPPLTVESLRGRVVLVRWFTEGCPYCSATAPSLVAFHDELAGRGLAVIGLYHHKSEAPLVDDDVRALAERFGFRFPVAIDRDWRTLTRWWMADHPESWTSVSFLIDRRGVVRFAHTGGAYAPGSADAAQMRAWIDVLLAEPTPPPG
jgi:thiol-disulfide isomerase/thioredoxin